MENERMSIYEMHKRMCYQNGRGVLELAPKVGNFDTFADFCDYYKRHYRPLLEQLAKDKPDTAARFIVDDFDTLCLVYLNEYENE